MSVSIFEIIGPVMIGPSSSGTAGMAGIGLAAREIIGEAPKKIRIEIHKAVQASYRMHGTDMALVAGLLGIAGDDPRLIEALDLARGQEIAVETGFLTDESLNPKTVRLILETSGGTRTVTGISKGGGSFIITDVDGEQVRQEDFATHPAQGKSAKQLLDKPLFTTMEELLEVSRRSSQPLWATVLEAEEAVSGRSGEEIIMQMDHYLQVMKEAVNKGLNEENRLVGGLALGQDAKMLAGSIAEGRTVSGGLLPMAMARALAAVEVNASMGRVVAAPTAGSCGVVPGCLLTLQEARKASDADVVQALLTAAGMGVIMAQQGVSFSGIIGGCQGEVGVASALAAAGLVQLAGGRAAQAAHAAAIALKNILGLSCDLVGGPVEIPCFKKNTLGVANAFAAADLALAGIESAIPPDQVIQALAGAQKLLPREFKLSPEGPLASTPCGREMQKRMDAKFTIPGCN